MLCRAVRYMGMGLMRKVRALKVFVLVTSMMYSFPSGAFRCGGTRVSIGGTASSHAWASSAVIACCCRPLEQVSFALTLCVLFPFSTYLSELFAPTVWIPLAAAFVMANQSGSVLSSCLLRLIGTVLASASVGLITPLFRPLSTPARGDAAPATISSV